MRITAEERKREREKERKREREKERKREREKERVLEQAFLSSILFFPHLDK
jgi:hypothetical protein